MSDFVFYEEQWNIRRGEIHKGGASPTSPSENDTKGPRGQKQVYKKAKTQK